MSHDGREFPRWRFFTTPDGNIYTLPAFGECYHCSVAQKLWINQTWLDTLGLEMPSTTDEFEAVMLAFKNDDPQPQRPRRRDSAVRRRRHVARGRLLADAGRSRAHGFA